MNLLLDTVTFLWLLSDSPKLSEPVRRAFLDPDREVYLSSISGWEIAIKNSLGRLPLPEPAEVFVPRMRKQLSVRSLALNEASTLQLGKLPVLHRDPFDRMLVCQAIEHGLTIATPDELVRRYPVRCLW